MSSDQDHRPPGSPGDGFPFETLGPLAVEDPQDAWEVVAQHRARFLTPVRQPLVLISQIQRSGGTLIAQLLDGHSQLHVHPSELHIGQPSKYHWPNLDLDRPLDAGDLFDQLFERPILKHIKAGYQKLSRAELDANPKAGEMVLPFIFLPRLQRDLFVRLLRRSPPQTQRDVLDAYATSYFNAWLDYQGLYRRPDQVKYWAVFAARLLSLPGNTQSIAADYPDGRLVAPVRDPVSWYASARRHSSDYHDLDGAMAHWTQANAAIVDALERRPDQVLLLQHEAMVTETERQMRIVSSFLGIDFEPMLLRPTFNGMEVVSDSSFGSKYGIDATSRDRSGELDSATRSAIRERAGPMYETLKAAATAHAARYGKD